MRVKIYQINSARDNANRKFMSLKDGEAVDSSIYDEVFNAEIDEMNLEEIYARFNTEGHPLHRGHSLSVSDIVVMNGKAHVQFFAPAVVTLCYAFLTIRMDDTTVLDYMKYAVKFLISTQQYFEWR